MSRSGARRRSSIHDVASRAGVSAATVSKVVHGVTTVRADNVQRVHDAIAALDYRLDPLASDIAFHVAILHATGNRFDAQLEGVISAALRISIRLTNSVKGVPQADVNLHKKVLDAIEAGEAQKARTAMENIINEVLDLIGSARRKSGKSTAPRQAR